MAVLLADIVRGLRAYGAPIVVTTMCAYLVCALAKMFMARCGFNPEGNVDAESSLQATFESLSEPALPWPSREEVRFAVRNQKAAIELM
eukprot:7372170-Alexandrium_andersonii.AAC.1